MTVSTTMAAAATTSPTPIDGAVELVKSRSARACVARRYRPASQLRVPLTRLGHHAPPSRRDRFWHTRPTHIDRRRATQSGAASTTSSGQNLVVCRCCRGFRSRSTTSIPGLPARRPAGCARGRHPSNQKPAPNRMTSIWSVWLADAMASPMRAATSPSTCSNAAAKSPALSGKWFAVDGHTRDSTLAADVKGVRSRRRARSSMAATLASRSTRFMRSPVDPRYVAKDARSVDIATDCGMGRRHPEITPATVWQQDESENSPAQQRSKCGSVDGSPRLR